MGVLGLETHYGYEMYFMTDHIERIALKDSRNYSIRRDKKNPRAMIRDE